MGTLKSTRMKTRLPLRSRSRIESVVIDDCRLPISDCSVYKLAYNCWHRISRIGIPIGNPQLAIGNASEPFAGDVLNQIPYSARIAPFIVVPRQHLDQMPADDFRILSIDNR